MQPPGTAYRTSTNGLAVASLVLGIVWIWGVGSILALIFGLVARSQISRSAGTQGGGGMAVAGIVLGAVGIALILIIIIVAAANSGSSSS